MSAFLRFLEEELSKVRSIPKKYLPRESVRDGEFVISTIRSSSIKKIFIVLEKVHE